MIDKVLHVTRDRVREAVKKYPDAEGTLRILFPTVFERDDEMQADDLIGKVISSVGSSSSSPAYFFQVVDRKRDLVVMTQIRGVKMVGYGCNQLTLTFNVSSGYEAVTRSGNWCIRRKK